MNVAYHSSDLFSPVVGVSMVSLFENNKEVDDICVYLLEKEISSDNKEKLQSIADKYNRRLVFIPMPDVNAEHSLNLKKIKTEWEFYSYVRLFLDKYLPQEIERVLYLDSDVLITSSLESLWSIDMKGYCAAAVKDCLGEGYYEALNLSDTAIYCNSGVILIDLNQWRRRDIPQKVREAVGKHDGRVFFVEQTVFNTILQNEILVIDANYNVSTLMILLKYNQLYRLRKIKRFYSEGEVKAAVKSPYIIHLTGCFMVRNRPWVDNCNHPVLHIYDKYRDMTPWRGLPKLADKRSIKKRQIDFVIAHLPKTVVIWIASFLYNSVRSTKVKKTAKK